MRKFYTLAGRGLAGLLLCSFLLSSNFLHAQDSYAVDMNGTSTSYVDLGTVSPAGNFSSGLTIECWAKWGAFNSWSRLLDLGNGSSSDNILLANQNTTNNPRFEVYSGAAMSGITGSTALQTGRWYHIAVTEDNLGNAKMYVDGVLVGSGTINVPANVGRSLCYIGKSNWAVDGYLNGTVDEMRIWNTVRTQAQIKMNMYKSIDPTTAALVAYYHFDEPSGTAVANSVSGAGAGDATAAAGVVRTASPIAFGANALNFDGVNDFVSLPNVVSSDFTVEYWMKTSSAGAGISGNAWYQGSGLVDAEVGGVTTDWGTSLTGNVVAFGIGGDLTIHSTSAVNTGNWVHVAASWKQSTGAMTLYINGVEEATGTGSTALRSAPPRITIGEIQAGGNYFNGTIDEVRIWNEVRSQAQVQSDMNREIDPTSADATNLAAYYTFNQNIAEGDNSGVVLVIDQKNDNNGTLNNFALTGTTSNFVAQNAALSVLPVQLASFTARKASGGVLVQWSTASEVNTSAFYVERSGDGQHWNDLARVAAAGSSSVNRDYHYVDARPLAGKNYYRLRQVDMDGRKQYSGVQLVVTEAGSRSFSLQSNHVTNGTIQLVAHRPVVLRLFTVDGKLLWSSAVKEGYQSILLPVKAGGVYVLTDGQVSEKLIAD